MEPKQRGELGLVWEPKSRGGGRGEAERQRSDSLPHPGDDRLATSLVEPQGGQVREKAEHQAEEGPDNATGAVTVGGNDISCL